MNNSGYGNGVSKDKAKDVYFKSLESYETDVMNVFKCNSKSWPICLFDYTFKLKIPE